MAVRRIMLLAGGASCVVWMAPVAPGVAAAALLLTGLGLGVVALGLAASRLVDLVLEPVSRPLRRADRCRLCRSGRVERGGIWVCSICDVPDPRETGLDPDRRGLAGV